MRQRKVDREHSVRLLQGLLQRSVAHGQSCQREQARQLRGNYGKTTPRSRWKHVTAVVGDSFQRSEVGAAQAATSTVDISGVRFTWPGAKSFTLTIDAFSLPARERVLLIGPSGSGKSTFLSLLAGINVPAAGTIAIFGTDIAHLGSSARDRFRAEQMGIIFQMFNLLAPLTWTGRRSATWSCWRS